jgi:uncharacterized protein involved in type VI secretion and phage assembly
VVLHAHIFAGSWDWYVAAYDTAYDTAYGFVVGIEPEWGSFWLREVEATKHPLVIVDGITGTEHRIEEAYYPEVDIYWEPITYRQLKERHPHLVERGAV